MTFEGEVWRYLPRGAHPLDLSFLLQADGRWNRAGEYACLYTSLTRNGAIAEYDKWLGQRVGLMPRDDAERDLVTIRVRLASVCDVTDAGVRRRLGVTREAITRDTTASLELCRTIADWARARQYGAILSPSAAAGSANNLNIYIDVRPADIELAVGSHCEALNY
ncbi:MAG: RES family NAD+ phosphorylase [Gemmatimonadales bacterium]|nr:RES family NAD+ phosphorylase [Gemmatimonadales bacterium]